MAAKFTSISYVTQQVTIIKLHEKNKRQKKLMNELSRNYKERFNLNCFFGCLRV